MLKKYIRPTAVKCISVMQTTYMYPLIKSPAFLTFTLNSTTNMHPSLPVMKLAAVVDCQHAEKQMLFNTEDL